MRAEVAKGRPFSSLFGTFLISLYSHPNGPDALAVLHSGSGTFPVCLVQGWQRLLLVVVKSPNDRTLIFLKVLYAL